MKKYIKIFDINFIDADFKKLNQSLIRSFISLTLRTRIGNNKNDSRYYKALKKADLVLFDSGYFCLLLRYLKNIKVKNFLDLNF